MHFLALFHLEELSVDFLDRNQLLVGNNCNVAMLADSYLQRYENVNKPSIDHHFDFAHNALRQIGCDQSLWELGLASEFIHGPGITLISMKSPGTCGKWACACLRACAQ